MKWWARHRAAHSRDPLALPTQRLLSPKPEESEKFFVDVMGMTVSGRKVDSVFLRGWNDYERYSLKLTASKTSGMKHMAPQRGVAALRIRDLKSAGPMAIWEGAGVPLPRARHGG